MFGKGMVLYSSAEHSPAFKPGAGGGKNNGRDSQAPAVAENAVPQLRLVRWRNNRASPPRPSNAIAVGSGTTVVADIEA
jgi:hypothetical protein